MRINVGTTFFDKLRIIIGALLVVAGLVMLGVSGTFSFTILPLTFGGIALVLIGMYVAGSLRIAEFINNLLG